ncbi:hypothetical protein [Microcoleus sp. FACHB-672]|uniref:hypothetical protein n=1 Tax=Microcoleus sp. FACHB-672 TaxID=2692825 RepID=UPI0016878935|nr:hypothetical protein [Microcoleus sp. FACHB-672]MBD2040874.1 hypothetical protein [Microcoleus sp. FACHB-672]
MTLGVSALESPQDILTHHPISGIDGQVVLMGNGEWGRGNRAWVQKKSPMPDALNVLFKS